MNPKEIDLWKKGVDEYMNILENLIDDRRKLKELMTDHLRDVFLEWDEIRFSKDFEEISIIFKQEFELCNSVLQDVGMDWEINVVTNMRGNLTKAIKLYPFGRGE